MNRLFSVLTTIALLCAGASGSAVGASSSASQFGEIVRRAQQAKDLVTTEADEIRLGEAVSERIRLRYGVAQDAAVHKYVALVGTALTEASTRAKLPFHFIVLDTDGVNAFAAPGGFVHVTRGALALMRSEADLAGVLAHEIEHVTEKHTMKAIQKGKLVQVGANEATSGNAAYFSQLIDKATDVVLAGFGREEELESDAEGVVLVNKVGYAPTALGDFLRRLAERNKVSSGKQGLFASHPQMEERLDKLSKKVTSARLTSSATLDDRYKKSIAYTSKPLSDVPVVAGAAGLTGGATSDTKGEKKASDAKPEEPRKKGFGLGALVRPGGSEKKSAEVTGSAASRGVDSERDARGGANPTLVAVQITPADVAAFKKAGNLR